MKLSVASAAPPQAARARRRPCGCPIRRSRDRFHRCRRHARKLSPADAIAAYRDAVVRGMSVRAVCRKYGVHHRTLQLLIAGQTYRDVPVVRGEMTLSQWESADA